MVPGLSCCKVCKKSADADDVTLKKCSRCQSVDYCSIACQKVDWKDGHKSICVKPKENADNLKTQFGTATSEDIEKGLLGLGPVVAYVLLPKSLAEVLQNSDKFKDKVMPHQKDGKMFIDVLSFFLKTAEDEDDESLEDKNEAGKSAEDHKRLDANLNNVFFLNLFAESQLKGLDYEAEKCAVDYLKVVQFNLMMVKEMFKTEMAAAMNEVPSAMMDRLEFLFYALHWMNCQALMLNGKAKLVLDDFKAARKNFQRALSQLQNMDDTWSFRSEVDKEQINLCRQRIHSCQEKMPENLLSFLDGKIVAAHNLDYDEAMLLRARGLIRLKLKDYHLAMEDLVSSNLVFLSQKTEKLDDSDKSKLFIGTGESQELCALYTVSANFSVHMCLNYQAKAVEMFISAKATEKVLDGYVRLFNWRRRGAVFARKTQLIEKLKHADFDVRIDHSGSHDADEHSSLSSLLPVWNPDRCLRMSIPDLFSEICRLLEQLRISVPIDCSLCRCPLSWVDAEDDVVEILIACKHAFHSGCLTLFVEANCKACPTCLVAFMD